MVDNVEFFFVADAGLYIINISGSFESRFDGFGFSILWMFGTLGFETVV